MFRHRLSVVIRSIPTSSLVGTSTKTVSKVKSATTVLTGISLIYYAQCTIQDSIAYCDDNKHSPASSSFDLNDIIKSVQNNVSAFFDQNPKTPGDHNNGENDPVKALLKKSLPFLCSLGVSGGMGVCCAVAFKRISNQMAYLIGIGFTSLQLLSYFGYITIDYDKLTRDSAGVLDINKDGKVNEDDVLAVYDRSKSILTKHVQDVGSFLTGFAFGLYFV